ncbi:histone H2A [Schistosoma bovis]|uniref:Histone H2A n=1 Tax=Schistosoma bovis TaxID=6184 RepID=A0A430Q1Z3_SCHBO|nr:histone H2A [Schistosoma bovis]RTG90832.1 histone H2A [Schistosoma bovis]RTG90833.1 histone H2A [Schistosoma bovis]
MSGRGKCGKVYSKAKIKSVRAGLQLNVGHVHCLLHQSNYTERVEYLTAEVLELTGNAARDIYIYS